MKQWRMKRKSLEHPLENQVDMFLVVHEGAGELDLLKPLEGVSEDEEVLVVEALQ